MPSNPYDAKGLLIASIEDDDPVVFFERSASTTARSMATEQARGAVEHAPQGRVPEGHYSVPIGKAEIVRKGAQ